MFSRFSSALLLFGASVALLALLSASLYWMDDSPADAEPLQVFAAEALRGPLEAIKQGYERESGQTVFVNYGPSHTILTQIEQTQKADLFLPADDSFIKMAKAKGLLGEVIDVARMRAVVIGRPDLDRKLDTWRDVMSPENKIGLANVEATAIGKAVKAHLEQQGLWDELAARKLVLLGNVNEAANATALGSIDVSIVWDVVARNQPKLLVRTLPEVDGIEARVQVALTRHCQQTANALRFARYLRARDKGAVEFKQRGFSQVEAGDAAQARPELVVYAGAMLRPAIEETLTEFEKREGVKIKRVFNGCGILVSQMRAGEHPDLYFACDPRFMTDVKDLFDDPQTVSSNQLVIALPRDNPHGIKTLGDLGKENLRLGVGHEQQCALGAITQETFLRSGVLANVQKNIKVRAPTGDMLINQLRTGALDVVVAYRSNVVPFADELLGIPVTGLDCAAPQQPIAVGRDSGNAELSRKLVEALRSKTSRNRFEKVGFEWGEK